MVGDTRTVKRTRKNHWCAYCGELIPKGSTALNEYGIGEEGPYSTYCCGACEPYVDGFWESVKDREVGGDLTGWFAEYLGEETPTIPWF